MNAVIFGVRYGAHLRGYQPNQQGACNRKRAPRLWHDTPDAQRHYGVSLIEQKMGWEEKNRDKAGYGSGYEGWGLTEWHRWRSAQMIFQEGRGESDRNTEVLRLRLRMTAGKGLRLMVEAVWGLELRGRELREGFAPVGTEVAPFRVAAHYHRDFAIAERALELLLPGGGSGDIVPNRS